MKPIIKKLRSDLLPITVYLIYGTPKQYSKFIKKEFELEEPPNYNRGMASWVKLEKGSRNHILYINSKTERTMKDLFLVGSHEACHTSRQILDYLQIEEAEGTNEMQSMLVGWLVENIFKEFAVTVGRLELEDNEKVKLKNRTKVKQDTESKQDLEEKEPELQRTEEPKQKQGPAEVENRQYRTSSISDGEAVSYCGHESLLLLIKNLVGSRVAARRSEATIRFLTQRVHALEIEDTMNISDLDLMIERLDEEPESRAVKQKLDPVDTAERNYKLFNKRSSGEVELYRDLNYSELINTLNERYRSVEGVELTVEDEYQLRDLELEEGYYLWADQDRVYRVR